jgi:F0F1-type ATP synthase delta subunit
MMFPVDRWAEAFLNTAGLNFSDGLNFLSLCAPALKTIPPEMFGLDHARDVSNLMTKALEKAGKTEKIPGWDVARAVIFIMIKRGVVHNIDWLIHEIKRKADGRAGIIHARLDAASEPDSAVVESLKRLLHEKTDATGVSLKVTIRPDLIGGCCLTVGNEIFDYSLKGELRQLSEKLMP